MMSCFEAIAPQGFASEEGIATQPKTESKSTAKIRLHQGAIAGVSLNPRLGSNRQKPSCSSRHPGASAKNPIA
jgi:hypothetical protein